MHRTTIVPLAMASLSLTLHGCQKNAVSETKSLDNLAAEAQVSSNECQGPYDARAFLKKIDIRSVSPERQSAVMASELAALSAVPSGLQTFFFDYAQGSIRITPDIERACGSAVEACVVLDPETRHPIVTLKDDAKVIAHHSVRLFAHLLADVSDSVNGSAAVAERTADPDRTAAFGAYIKAFKLYLTEAFIEDLRARPGSAGLLGTFERARSSESQFNAMQTEVFADAFDSAYCSAATRQVLADKQFKKTCGAFYGFISEPLSIRAKPTARSPEKVYSLSWRDFAKEQESQGPGCAEESGGLALQSPITPLGHRPPLRFGPQNFSKDFFEYDGRVWQADRNSKTPDSSFISIDQTADRQKNLDPTLEALGRDGRAKIDARVAYENAISRDLADPDYMKDVARAWGAAKADESQHDHTVVWGYDRGRSSLTVAPVDASTAGDLDSSGYVPPENRPADDPNASVMGDGGMDE